MLWELQMITCNFHNNRCWVFIIFWHWIRHWIRASDWLLHNTRFLVAICRAFDSLYKLGDRTWNRRPCVQCMCPRGARSRAWLVRSLNPPRERGCVPVAPCLGLVGTEFNSQVEGTCLLVAPGLAIIGYGRCLDL